MTTRPRSTDPAGRRPGGALAAVLAVALGAAACAAPAVRPGASPDPAATRAREEAEDLLRDRRYAAALALLDRAARADPTAAEPHADRAYALFRTERLDEALAACGEALRRNPNPLWILPTCWAAELDRGGFAPDARAQVRADVEALRSGDEPPLEALFAARRGLDLLGDEERRDALTLEIASRAEGTAYAADAARMVFEALLSARPAGGRRRLAETYLWHFPDGREAYPAARIYLRELSPGLRTADAPAVVRSLPGAGGSHRRVDAAAAAWLIEREEAPGLAVDLLTGALAQLARETRSGEEQPESLAEDRSRYRYLLGRALLQAGDRKRAEAALEDALAGEAIRPDAELLLGRLTLEAGRTEEAIRHLRAALARPARWPEAEALLSRALTGDPDGNGDPREYFRRHEGGPRFEDVTGAAGLGNQRAERVAWGDGDGDGRPDLLLDGRRLFRNRGDGAFEDVTREAGLEGEPRPNGGLWADVDDDGDLDLLVTSRAGNRLWRNGGDGHFTDVTAEAFGSSPPWQTEAAAWGDLDGDGWLDLYLANYERPGPWSARCVGDRLLRNRGDGTFADVTERAGIVSEEPMCGRGVTWTDFDDDGRADVVVGNYRLDPDFLWRNRGDGSFVDVAGERGVRGNQVGGAFGHTIGVVSGDLDGDGDLDLFVSNLAHPRYRAFSDRSMLLLNSGPPAYRFVDRFADSGIAFEETSSDPALADVDGDGDLDLYVTSIYPGRYAHLYLNRGDGTFVDGTWLSGTAVANAWGAAFADADGDGDPDLAVASRDGMHLFRNDAAGVRWLSVTVDDRRCNRFGVGARVTVSYADTAQVREIAAGRGTGSQDGFAAIFGLGDYDGPVEVEARTACGDVLRARVEGPETAVVLRHPPP